MLAPGECATGLFVGLDAGMARDAGDGVVRFIAVGDTGKGTSCQTAVGEAMGAVCAMRGCDFVVLLGDNFYPSGVESTRDELWQAAFVGPYETVNAPFFPVLGNHDYGGNGAGFELHKADVEVAYSAVNPKWRLPAAHHRFSVGDAEFFVLDTNRTFWGFDGKAREDIAAWLGSSRTPWKIAFGHHPLKSNGPHGNAGDYDRRCLNAFCAPGCCAAAPGFADGRNVQSFLDGLVCGKVDVYLSGHDHSLQWLSDTCAGTQLIVSGAGASATSVNGSNAARFQSSELGFVYVELEGRTFTGTFYDQRAHILFRHAFTK
jgi:predicted phosphodiesterase